MAKQKQLYILRLELLGISPTIWRRVRVPVEIDLASLHYIFQIAMGWTDSHLHLFEIDGHEYQMNIEEDDDLSYEASIPLSSVLNNVREFIYAYDFGDNWQHRVIVESIAKMDAVWDFPICLAGERACPPEDVGGIGGYEDFVETISSPENDEYESMLLWAGGVYDPEGFDVNRVNRELNGFCLHFESTEDDA